MLKLKLNYDRQSVCQSFLVSGTHLGPLVNFSFSLEFHLDSCGFVVCSALSRGTHDHILLYQFLRLPEPGGPGPRIYIPQEQGGPGILQGTGFPFVASYNSQGYGGGILSHLHSGL
jgi:hypothetical protein